MESVSLEQIVDEMYKRSPQWAVEWATKEECITAVKRGNALNSRVFSVTVLRRALNGSTTNPGIWGLLQTLNELGVITLNKTLV